jgi:PBP1b-binding outer membrane lipoprotein LpoB
MYINTCLYIFTSELIKNRLMKKLMTIGLAMCMSIVFKSCENPKENVFKESEVLTNIDPTELDVLRVCP